MNDKIQTKTPSALFEFKLNKVKSNNLLEYPKKSKVFFHDKRPKFENVNYNKNKFVLFKLIFFQLILMLLPKQVLLIYKHSIKLRVSVSGFQRIFSDKYNGPYPNITYINDDVTIFRKEKLDINSPDYVIKMLWEKPLSDFTYMFSDSINIIYIEMNDISEQNCNMSYMFYNCTNLNEVKYISNYGSSHLITDTIGMFYNCISLTTFSFDNFFMEECSSPGICNSDNYFYRNMSYMFYNCQYLKNISFLNNIKYVSDMKYMFYNCTSLESIELTKFETNSCLGCYIDMSYMFYNCKNLSTIILTQDIYVKNIYKMFYNSESLESIDIQYFKSSNLYHINMSYLFYNCEKLEAIKGDFNNFFISDTRNMFFNCKSLRYKDNNNEVINIYINTNDKINMSKMFYNCESIKNVNILPSNINNYNYIFPNDLNSMFYNCYSLISVNLEYFRTDNVRNLSYMFYNCKQLKDFTRNDYSYNPSLLIKKRTMKGMFQNCESLESLDLSGNFETKNVEIMWDMFKGCSKLTNLSLLNPETFDTSQVTDMESMFEECTSLLTLNISNFNTENVQYMNQMFYNCFSLKSLYFHSISSSSLGTMYRMFYNCSSLEYLDLYSLTEKSQSIAEMFEGVSTDFEFCIKENEDMPNIFKMLSSLSHTTRDCSTNCYYEEKRPNITEKKLCCKYVKFEDNCYEKCPSRTMVQSLYKECENFTCPYDKSLINYEKYIYYNFEQDNCTDQIPDKYFLNDTELKTMDKCHDDCATCLQKETDENHTNCETCETNKPYIYLGNCYKECRYGNYTENGKIKCYCFNEKCLYCPEPVARMGLCTECNTAKGYYKLSYIKNDTFDCYSNLKYHYFSNNSFFVV